MDIVKILTRMYKRRTTKQPEFSKYTLSYAISAATGRCYIGWNSKGGLLTTENGNAGDHFKVMDRKNLVRNKAGIDIDYIYSEKLPCAEASALYVALSWGEKIGNLIFFASNANGEPFHPCELCQEWVPHHALGYLRKEKEKWVIQVRRLVTRSEETALGRAEVFGFWDQEDECRDYFIEEGYTFLKDLKHAQ